MLFRRAARGRRPLRGFRRDRPRRSATTPMATATRTRRTGSVPGIRARTTPQRDYSDTPTPGVFGHTYNTAGPPDDPGNEQRKAAIQQLFYDVNFFHDWYYDSGFD